mgnify:CR=1 FL=1
MTLPATFPDLPTDPPDPVPPCECNAENAKSELRERMDDILAAWDLEWADDLTIKRTNQMLDDLIDKLVAPVGVCEDCRPEKERET